MASAPTSLETKEAALVAWLRARGSVLVGFSGGGDSAYLACVAVEALGPAPVLAVIGRSASYPAAQWARARGRKPPGQGAAPPPSAARRLRRLRRPRRRR